jgi:hypothetical protein
MNAPKTNPTTALLQWAHFFRITRGMFGVMLLAGMTAALLFVVSMSGCKNETSGIVNYCVEPTVIRTSPASGATNESLNKTSGATSVNMVAAVKIITATFSTPMDPKSMTTTTFTVQQGNIPISGTVSYSDTTALFVIPNSLGPNLTYTCTITAGAKSTAGVTLAHNYVWSFTTIAPGTPTLVAPVNGAVNISTSPTLSWNVVPGADTYRLQVSTSNLFTTSIYNDSTRTSTSQSISGLTIGTTYYWRVNSKISGGTSAYSTVWSFTTIAPPAAPVLVAPVDVAVNISTSPTLTWNASIGAATYRLQVSTSNLFATTLFDDSTITGTSQIMASLTTGTTYYWRVNAKNVAGTSAYSARSFTVIAPGTPTLVAPVDSAVNVSTSPTLIWNAVSGANSYRLQVSTSNTFATTVYDDSTRTSTSQLISGLNVATTYYWRVNSKISSGTSAYSTVWRFTTIAPPAAPVLIAPLDAAQNQPTSLTLSWNASVGASTYRLQISTSSLFTSTIYNDSTITGTSQPITGLLVGTTYYWRVNAKNTAGTSAYSTRNFTTIVAALQAPLLAAPADADTVITTSPTLSWNASTGAATYRLQVDTSSSFTNPVYNDSTIAGISQPMTGLVNGKTYYWRVNAKNSGGTSAYSTTWRFIVAPSVPPLLGSASTFGIMATSAITSTGNSVINGDVSLDPGTSMTGFPPAVVNGTIHINDLVSAQARTDLLVAYNSLKNLAPGTTISAGADLGALYPLGIPPGTYTSGSTMLVSTPLVLDAGGNANAVWVFQIGSSLTTGASVTLTGSAQAKNVYWVPTLDATIGVGTIFNGTIVSGRDVTAVTGSTINGRILAGATTAGTIALQDATITVPAP